MLAKAAARQNSSNGSGVRLVQITGLQQPAAPELIAVK
jgi:hypothetical protein